MDTTRREEDLIQKWDEETYSVVEYSKPYQLVFGSEFENSFSMWIFFESRYILLIASRKMITG